MQNNNTVVCQSQRSSTVRAIKQTYNTWVQLQARQAQLQVEGDDELQNISLMDSEINEMITDYYLIAVQDDFDENKILYHISLTTMVVLEIKYACIVKQNTGLLNQFPYENLIIWL